MLRSFEILFIFDIWAKNSFINLKIQVALSFKMFFEIFDSSQYNIIWLMQI